MRQRTYAIRRQLTQDYINWKIANDSLLNSGRGGHTQSVTLALNKLQEEAIMRKDELQHCDNNIRMLHRHQKSKFKVYLKEYWQLYTLILPAIIAVFIFAYIPMYGAQIAFRDYEFKLGYWGSEWVGFKHFIRFFTGNNFLVILKNTLGISLYQLIAGFPIPIMLAIMLNELKSQKLKKIIQMLTYAPHFISTVAICGLLVMFLQRDTGLINLLIGFFGGEGKDFLTDPKCFKTIYVLSGIWQGMGWSSIIYIAALSSVDTQIVEAARVDGANRLQKIWHIDLTSIKPTIIILLILQVGTLMNIGHEKILLLQNALNMSSSDVISTYVYRVGVQGAQYSYTTAIGLFNSIVNIILLIVVNQITKKIGESSLF